MSRYEWERGAFIIPSAEWAKFKAKIRTAVNSANQIKYEMAVQLYESVVSRKKAEKGATFKRLSTRKATN